MVHNGDWWHSGCEIRLDNIGDGGGWQTTPASYQTIPQLTIWLLNLHPPYYTREDGDHKKQGG